MFKLQSPSKYSPFDAIHILRLFPLLKTVFELVDFDAYSAVAIFYFTFSTSTKHSHLRTFSFGETKKNWSGQDWMNREGGAWGSGCFWSKIAEHSALHVQGHS